MKINKYKLIFPIIALVLVYPFLWGNPYISRWHWSDFNMHVIQVTQGWGLPLYYWGDWFLRLLWYPLSLVGLSANAFYIAVIILSLPLALWCLYKLTGTWLVIVFVLVGCYGVLEYFVDAITVDFIALYIIGIGYLYIMQKWLLQGKWMQFADSFLLLLFASLFHYKAGLILIAGSGLYLLIMLFTEYRNRASVSLTALPLVVGIVYGLYQITVNGGHLTGEIGFMFGREGEMLSGAMSLKTFLTWQFNPFTLVSVLLSGYLLIKLRNKFKFEQILPLLLVLCFVAVLIVGCFSPLTRHPDRFGLDLSIWLCIGLTIAFILLMSQLQGRWRVIYPTVVFGNLGFNALVVIPRYAT